MDSYGAYQKDLVKKIEVKTVHGVIPKDFPYIRYLSFTSDLKAKVEIFSQEQGGVIRFKSFNVSGGTSIYELSGGLSQYEDMRIAEQPHKLKPLQVATRDKIISRYTKSLAHIKDLIDCVTSYMFMIIQLLSR